MLLAGGVGKRMGVSGCQPGRQLLVRSPASSPAVHSPYSRMPAGLPCMPGGLNARPQTSVLKSRDRTAHDCFCQVAGPPSGALRPRVPLTHARLLPTNTLPATCVPSSPWFLHRSGVHPQAVP